MSKTFRRILVGFLFGFVVYLALILFGDARQVGSQLKAFNWQLIPFILAGTLFNYLLRFIKWHYYLGLIGITSIDKWMSARIFVAGFPLAVTPGKIGEALKGVWLNHTSGVSTSHGMSVVLAERISDGLAVLALSTLGVIAYPQYWPAFAFVLGGLVVFILITQFQSLAMSIIDKMGKLPWARGISAQLQSFYEGTNLLFRPAALVTAVLLGIFAWLGEGIAMYLVLLGLGVDPGVETFSMAVFILSFSTVIGAVSAMPGGIGAAEVSIAGMLALLLGLAADRAATATIIIRFATLWFGVALGLGSWIFSRDFLLAQVPSAGRLSGEVQTDRGGDDEHFSQEAGSSLP
jgi:uncharacterized protein (TIRG00374 family)